MASSGRKEAGSTQERKKYVQTGKGAVEKSRKGRRGDEKASNKN